VLGFEVMPRPNFPFPGYWLGINDKIQVHLAQAGVDNAELYYLGTPKISCTTISPPRGLPFGSARYAESLWPSEEASSMVLPTGFLLRDG